MVQDFPSSEPSDVGQATIASSTSTNRLDRTELPLLLAFMLIWYGFWLWLSAGPPSHRPVLYLTFNSMLEHLLKGRFDVDPQIVGFEGYLRNGQVYSYWGIWCALLRFPLWVFHRLDVDITIWSCLVAVCIACTAKVQTVLLLRKFDPQNPNTRMAIDLLLVYFVMGGSGTAFLKATIYQEIILWGAAFGAIFVYFAVKGLVSHSLDIVNLSGMAVSAGLALLTRVSMGTGLVVSFALLLLALMVYYPDAARSSASASTYENPARLRMQVFLTPRILVPIAIIMVCMATAAIVNYFRWGNPITFVNFNFYLGNTSWHDRVSREASYGLFNLRRVPFGLMYYFLPVWAMRTSAGEYLFTQTRLRMFDGVELPASSFLLTDLLPICFIFFLFIALIRRYPASPASKVRCAALAAGLMLPCVLMLSAVYEAYRYRMEFYPEIDFLAILGLYLVLTHPDLQAVFARLRVWMVIALAISSLSSLGMLIIYQHSYFGPARLFQN